MKKDYSKLKSYFDESGDDDMSKLERRKVSGLGKLLKGAIFFLLFSLAVLAVGWFLFGRQPAFTGNSVKLTIDAPAVVNSGQEVIYIINYGNFEEAALRVADLVLKYPEGFVFDSSSPKPTEDNNRFTIGTVGSGKTGKIEIKGKLIGEAASTKTITAILSYVPANFSSEFQKVESADTRIGESSIVLKIDGPTNALAGDKVSYLITIKNEGKEKFSDLRLTASYPDGFNFVSVKPEASEDDSVWKFASLDPDEEKEIKIDGEISSTVQDKLEFKWELGIGTGKNYVVQQAAKSVTDVVKGDLTMDLIINGANESRPANFGDTLNYSISYKNNSDTRLSEFSVKLTINSVHLKNSSAVYGSGILNFDTLKDINNGLVVSVDEQPKSNVLDSKTITWTKKEVRNLTFLDPDEAGQLDFSLKLKSLDILKSQAGIGEVDELAVESVVEMSVGKTGNLVSSTVVKSNNIVTALNTNLRLNAEGRYYDANDQTALGSGPLPPQAGQTTNYRIFWTLNNDLHEVKEVTVFAVLPKEVQWNNKFDIGAGEINYNVNSRTVTWKINRLPVSVTVLKASFEVGLTPTKEQVGQIVTLLPRSILTALDSQTQGKLTQSTSAITTDLESDSKASGKGIVAQGIDLIR